jgi:hypothetical protein
MQFIRRELMNKIAISVLMFSMLSVTASVFGADVMRPGLWEMSVILSPQQMATMPKNMNIPGLVGNMMTRPVCVTPAQAQNLDIVNDLGEQSCKIVNKTVVGTTYTIDFVCNAQNKNGRGRATTVFQDSVHFTAVMSFQGTAHGKNVIQEDKTSGKWLNPNCGSVR